MPVLREELLLVTMPTHPLAKRKRIVPQDLAGQPFVLFEAGSATRRVIDRFFLSENIEPTIVMDTENVEIIKAMVKTGLGIGIVPYQAIAREVRARGSSSARASRGTSWCAKPAGVYRARQPPAADDRRDALGLRKGARPPAVRGATRRARLAGLVMVCD